MSARSAVRAGVVASAVVALGLTGLGCPDESAPGGSLPVLGTVPPFTLTDESGATVDSTALEGHVWVASFIFTRCGSTCPIQSGRMAELQKRLAADPFAYDVRLVSFSVDPEYDTPEVLTEYAGRFGAVEGRWRFLTGSRAAIWELCEGGFKLPVEEGDAGAAMPIVHATRFVLVDAEGRIRAYPDGQTEDGVRETYEGIGALLSESGRGARGARPVPEEILTTPWLEARRRDQLASAGTLQAFHDFRFRNRAEESGIRFRHRIVDDAGKSYKAAHYDHGNGLAVADVDGDDRLDLYFRNQVGPSQLWRNLGQGRFEDITERAGVAVDGPIGASASFADIDNDGDADLYVTNVRAPNRLFENDGTGRFRDISQEAGVDYSGHSSAGVFFDYDRDGLLDLFLANVGVYTTDELREVGPDIARRGPAGGSYRYHVAFADAFGGHLKPERAERSILYRNLGANRFRDVSAETGLTHEGWAGDATALDWNRDGFIDLYALNMQGHDTLWTNDQGKKFIRQLLTGTPWGSMGIKFFDFDNDGLLDIYVTDMHSDMSVEVGPESEKLKSRMQWPESFLRTGGLSIFGNALFRTRPDGSLGDVSDAVNAENYWPWGISVADLNADGYDDVFISSGMNYPFRYGINTVLLNENGQRFADAEFILGVEPRSHTAQPWFEIDCAGTDAGHRDCRPGDGRLVVWGATGSRSSAIVDLDADGDLDIVTNELNAGPLVLVSDLAQRARPSSIEVRLVGGGSNRDGLGSSVRVRAGGRTYTKVQDGQSGYLSHSRIPLYFGLGSAQQADEVIVRWPSGREQTLPGPVAAGQRLVIRER